MSEEISRRLTEAAAAHGAEADSLADVAHITASIIGPARRKRRVTGVATVAAACAAVAVFAGGSLAVANSLGDRDASPATGLSNPNVGVSVLTVQPSPSDAVAASPQADEGIDTYPPLAPAHGTGYPSAYVMKDWVWNHVGSGWSLQSYSLTQDPYTKNPAAAPSAAVYLVGPQGAAFELAALPTDASAGLRVVSWQEDERTAHVEWDDPTTGTSSRGAELNLDTGALAPIVFTTPWGVSSTVAPVAVTATGNELWAAWLGTHVRYYRFGTADGWTVATLNDLEGLEDRTANVRWGIADQDGAYGMSTRDDGKAVLFERRASNGDLASGAPTELAVYDVDADVYVTSDVTKDFGAGQHGRCIVTGWFGGDELGYTCVGTTNATIIKLQNVPEGGESSAFRMRPADEATGSGPRLSGYVAFGEAPPHDALFPR